MTEFRAKAIDIAGRRLHHIGTSKFDLGPDLDPRVEGNLKILSMLWEDLVEGFRAPPRGARTIGSRASRGSDPTSQAVVGKEIARAASG